MIVFEKRLEVTLLKLQLHKKHNLSESEIEIKYSVMNKPLERIINYIYQQDYTVQGVWKNTIYPISLNDILYFEVVDRKTFLYTMNHIFECKKSIILLEHELEKTSIIKIGKGTLMNISSLKSVKPYPNHRLLVELKNGENLIVSRKYIQRLQEKMRGEYHV